MSDNPAPRAAFASGLPIDPAAKAAEPPKPVGFDECWKYCIGEAERSELWRDEFAARGAAKSAAHHGRKATIYRTLMKLLDRNKDPVILARLKELSASEAAEAKLTTGDETNDGE